MSIDDEIDKRIKNILEATKGGISKDSIQAIISLEDEIYRDQALIRLIKNGDVIAIYEGDRTRPYDPDKFLIRTKNEIMKNMERNDN